MEIIRELDKKFLMYCYSIYIIDTWSILAINNSTLMFIYQPCVICKSTCLEITSLWSNHTILPFSQHVSRQCYNPPGILSSTAGILLFNSVFHDRVTPVSVSTLKPPLRVIGVLLLKPQVSPIVSVWI